ncbi:MAG: NTP transferase domain-containing protein [Nitrospirales bacterium]|nr:NTP transferase domain-containing protein [Nitrospirales bacterium]
MSQTPLSFTAVVLAGDRKPGDPIAEAAGVSGKAFAPVGGKPMVIRVLDALDAAKSIEAQILCGPPQTALHNQTILATRVSSHRVRWVEPQATPSASAYHVMQGLPDTTPVLLTTADHALLTSDMVDYFCTQAVVQKCDLAVGVVPYELVAKAYPGMRRTATRLRDGAYCSCNLFAFVTPAAWDAAAMWCQVEQNRKRPWKIVQAFGWGAVLQYVLGRLSLSDGFARVSTKMGFNVQAVLMPYAQAAVDVDTVEDWKFVESLVRPQDAPRLSQERQHD